MIAVQIIRNILMIPLQSYSSYFIIGNEQCKRSCGAWACWPFAFLISVRKWPTTDHCLESDERHFSFDNMKKQPTRNSPHIKRIHCSVGRSHKALGKPNHPLLSIHWPQKRPGGSARSPGLDVIGTIPWTQRKLDWVTVCPITRRSVI